MRLNRGLSNMAMRKILMQSLIACSIGRTHSFIPLEISDYGGKGREVVLYAMSFEISMHFNDTKLSSTRLISGSFHYGGAFCNAQ